MTQQSPTTEGTAMDIRPEPTPVAQLWRSVVLGMTLVVLLAILVVLVAA
jgi:hypothetical protein